MFSTVLELTTTRFMTKRRSKFACGRISALPRSRRCLLFSLHARVYLTFPLTKTYGYSRLCDRCNYMETAFFAIVCDCLRSAIVCDRLRLYGNQPLDRTWFYLLRSSAITIAGSQTIAEVFPYDRRRSQTLLRSAIRDHMETSLKKSVGKERFDGPLKRLRKMMKCGNLRHRKKYTLKVSPIFLALVWALQTKYDILLT